MKEPRHHAWISWLPPQKGGRTQVPTGHYWLDARFDRQRNWPKEGWSLVVHTTHLLEGNRLQVARIDFLVDDAPHEWLVAGARFELLDGTHVVAHGLVVHDDGDRTVSREAIEEVLLV